MPMKLTLALLKRVEDRSFVFYEVKNCLKVKRYIFNGIYFYHIEYKAIIDLIILNMGAPGGSVS